MLLNQLLNGQSLDSAVAETASRAIALRRQHLKTAEQHRKAGRAELARVYDSLADDAAQEAAQYLGICPSQLVS